MTEGYEALRRGAAWMDLSARGRIVARGRDRARFLHNVTSNEVKKMTPGSSCYAFLLSPQGRIQADLSLICFEDRFLIDTEPELREKVRQQILRYKVADQVDLEDVTETTASIGVEGPDAGGVQLAPAIVSPRPSPSRDSPDSASTVRRANRRISSRSWSGRAYGRRRRRTPAWSASKTASRCTGKISGTRRCRRKPSRCRG